MAAHEHSCMLSSGAGHRMRRMRVASRPRVRNTSVSCTSAIPSASESEADAAGKQKGVGKRGKRGRKKKAAGHVEDRDDDRMDVRRGGDGGGSVLEGARPEARPWHQEIIGDPPERTVAEGPYVYVRSKEDKPDEIDIAPSNRPDGSAVRPSTWQDGSSDLGTFDEEWNLMWTESEDLPFSNTRFTVDIDVSVAAPRSRCYEIFLEREAYYRFMPFVHSIAVVDASQPELARVEMYYRYQFYPTLQIIFGLLTVEKRRDELIAYETDSVPGEEHVTRHGVFPMKADIHFSDGEDGATTKVNVVVNYAIPHVIKHFDLEKNVRQDIALLLTQAMRNYKKLAEGRQQQPSSDGDN